MQKTFKLITGAGNADKTAEMLRKAEGELENYTRLAALRLNGLKHYMTRTSWLDSLKIKHLIL